MIEFRRSILIGAILLLYGISNAQIINSYGIKIGIGAANQRSQEKIYSTNHEDSYLTEYRVGFIGQVFAEKDLHKYFSLRFALGYIQKGYIDYHTVLTGNERHYLMKQNVVFHNLSSDLSFKITPIKKEINAYILIGFRGDYLLDAKSEMTGYTLEPTYETYFEEGYRNFNIGPIIGAGYMYGDLIYFEFEYNPSIFKTAEFATDHYIYTIRGNYFSLNIGLNLNKLINS